MELKNFKNKLIESFVGNTVIFALNLLFPLIVSRLYGVEMYGSYVYGMTIVSIALFLANLGMDIGLIYFIPKTGNKYVSSCFVINVFTSIGAIVLIYIFMPSSLNPYLALVWLLSAEQLFFSLYRVKHHIKEFFIIKAVVGMGGKILIAYVLYLIFGLKLENIIIATYVSVLVSLIIYTIQNYKMFGKLEMHLEFLSYSVTIILGGVMSLIISFIDIVMIEAMLTKADVGLYKVGAELAQIPSIFLLVVNTVFPPLISKLYHEGKIDEVRALYEKITRYIFLFSSIIIIVLFLLWKPILLSYGEEYLSAKMVLIYRGIGQLINASVGSVWYIVIMTGHPKIRFFSALFAAIINCILNYILIPMIGIEGAALASMISTIFINVLGFFVVKRILHSKVYYII